MPKLGKTVARYETINGIRYKWCGRCKQFVFVDNFYMIKSGRLAGKLRSHCMDCDRRRQGVEKMVPITRIHLNWLKELENRLGIEETHRRLGLSQQWLWQVKTNKIHRFHKRTLRKIVTLLKQVRETEEVRHRDSIKHGASARGREEKKVKAAKDLYRRHGDNSAEYKRKERSRSE